VAGLVPAITGSVSVAVTPQATSGGTHSNPGPSANASSPTNTASGTNNPLASITSTVGGLLGGLAPAARK